MTFEEDEEVPENGDSFKAVEVVIARLVDAKRNSSNDVVRNFAISILAEWDCVRGTDQSLWECKEFLKRIT